MRRFGGPIGAMLLAAVLLAVTAAPAGAQDGAPALRRLGEAVADFARATVEAIEGLGPGVADLVRATGLPGGVFVIGAAIVLFLVISGLALLTRPAAGRPEARHAGATRFAPSRGPEVSSRTVGEPATAERATVAAPWRFKLAVRTADDERTVPAPRAEPAAPPAEPAAPPAGPAAPPAEPAGHRRSLASPSTHSDEPPRVHYPCGGSPLSRHGGDSAPRSSPPRAL